MTASADLLLWVAVNGAARVEKLVGEAGVRAQQVRLDAARWLHRHLGAVLQDVDRELGTRHARQPHAEILVNLYHERIDRRTDAARGVARNFIWGRGV